MGVEKKRKSAPSLGKTNKTLLLAFVLVIAGATHCLAPQVFLPAMPPYLMWHEELILITGWLEVLAAGGLLFQPLRRTTAWSLVVYFIAIWPVHFHVAIHGIRMFGTAHPAILWGRTLFQIVFIGWAYRLTR